MTTSDIRMTTLMLGPLQTNCYLLCDRTASTAVVVDPAAQAEVILGELERQGCSLQAIWVTHAHFDHIGAVSDLQDASGEKLEILLHEADHPLWKERGGADRWGVTGYRLEHEPTRHIEHGDFLTVGETTFEVRHTPGHSPGHVIFVARDPAVVCCGDVIFYEGVGRTDLPGGDWDALERSIREQVFTLPDTCRLFPGHGEATSVGHERSNNPFVAPERGASV